MFFVVVETFPNVVEFLTDIIHTHCINGECDYLLRMKIIIQIYPMWNLKLRWRGGVDLDAK